MSTFVLHGPITKDVSKHIYDNVMIFSSKYGVYSTEILNFEHFKYSSIFKCLSDEINMPGICVREVKDLTVVN